jgi:hypothetical protein
MTPTVGDRLTAAGLGVHRDQIVRIGHERDLRAGLADRNREYDRGRGVATGILSKEVHDLQ